jgi:hypothetical protein
MLELQAGHCTNALPTTLAFFLGWCSMADTGAPALLSGRTRPADMMNLSIGSCMLFGLQEVALPSISEAKRAWTLIY